MKDFEKGKSHLAAVTTQASKEIDSAGRFFALLRHVLNVVSAYGGGRAWHYIVSVLR